MTLPYKNCWTARKIHFGPLHFFSFWNLKKREKIRRNFVMVLVLLSALVERFIVSRKREFFEII